MSAGSLAQLRTIFPQRYALLAEEVALVIRGSTARGVVQRVREGMAQGRYLGARKIDGRWQLPLEDLAEILEPTPQAIAIQPPRSTGMPLRVGRRRSAIGPRLTWIHELHFWARVAGTAGLAEYSETMRTEADGLRQEGRYARDRERALELERRFEENTPQATGPSRRGPGL